MNTVDESDRNNALEYGIAIIGMAGYFPGAHDINAFWKMLHEGRDGLIPGYMEHGKDGCVPPFNSAYQNEKNFVSQVYGLTNKTEFDADFFGISPHEAQMMDPQHRLFLETAWHALEHACVIPDATTSPVGVYASCGFNAYLINNLRGALPPDASMADYLEAIVGNDKEYIATRTSYKLNLTGPSIAVQSACSSSLTAIILACQGLLDYQCDMAIAGGSSIQMGQDCGYYYEDGLPVSQGGKTRAFDAGADGVAGGSGCAAIVLKRYADAVADNDCIYGVIYGYGLNNDGSDKVTLSAPSVSGQARAIAEALESANIDPADIGYIECHGTGTELGDPIEIAALSKVYINARVNKKISIGSVKTNVGHLDTASGVTALIKAALMLHYEKLVPSLNYDTPNPKINFEQTPFEVCTSVKAWPRSDIPRFAAVSSFGFGGTNTHVIVGDAPDALATLTHKNASLVTPTILPISGRTSSALTAMANILVQELPTQDIAKAASVLQRYRKRFSVRHAVIAQNTADAISALQNENGVTGQILEKEPQQIFVFPSQGNVGLMGSSLMSWNSVYKQTLKRLMTMLEKPLQDHFYSTLFEVQSSKVPLEQVHPEKLLTFMRQYALALQMMDWGIHPHAVAGEDIGVYVAACISGVMDEKTALHLVQLIMQGTFVSENEKVPLSPAKIPILSIKDGVELGEGSLKNSNFWLQQANQKSADYFDASRWQTSPPMISLVFASSQNENAISQQESDSKNYCFYLAHDRSDEHGDIHHMLHVIAHLWVLGIEPSWDKLPGAVDCKVGLPGYAFEKKRFWRMPDAKFEPTNNQANDAELLPLRELDDWFMAPTWVKAVDPMISLENKSSDADDVWLLLASQSTQSIAKCMQQQLMQAGKTTVLVYAGDTFIQKDAHSFIMRMNEEADFASLAHVLKELKVLPKQVVLFWPMEMSDGSLDQMTQVRKQSLDSQVYLFRYLSGVGCDAYHLTVVAQYVFNVLPEDVFYPVNRMLLAPAIVSTWEHPDAAVTVIDVGDITQTVPENIAKRLIAECYSLYADNISGNNNGQFRAWRFDSRWIQDYTSLKLPIPEPLRLSGPCLITGGLGGVGLAYARMLAKRGVSPLVLAGRKSIVPRDQWNNSLDDSTVAALMEFEEEYRVQVLPVSLDCSDFNALEKVVADVEQKYGAFCGVVHAAGVSGGGMMVSGLPGGQDSNFHAKLAVLVALDTVFAQRDLQFFHLCSSLGSIFGALGQTDNCASNLVLDAYADWARYHRPWKINAINWDRWEHIGMASDLEARHLAITGEALPEAMQEKDAMAAAMRILDLAGAAGAQIVVACRDPFIAAEQMQAAQRIKMNSNLPFQQHKAMSSVENLSTCVGNPSNISAVEQILIELWSSALGVNGVNVNDDFMQLGGDSLIAIPLMRRIRKVFRMEVPLKILFETRTIAGLVQWMLANEVKKGQTELVAKAVIQVRNMQVEQGNTAQMLS